MGTTKYLLSSGSLSRKDNSLVFNKNGKNIYIPVESTKEIYCFGEVAINTKLMEFLSDNHIIMHHFNYYSRYIGTFYPRDHYMSGRLLITQIKRYDEMRIVVAKAIIRGIAKNVYEVLYHYYKHSKPEVKQTIDWLKTVPLLTENVSSIYELLQIEGEVWLRFYSNFRHFLSNEFWLGKRVKRPPDNPINAMISFGNSLLYTKTISAIYQTHLDQRISYLHEPSERRFSLSLDLCEVFKPVIVFRCIFELVNNRRLQAEKHFEQKTNFCLLNENGRKIFVESFESRMETVFPHATLKRKTSYRTALKLDAYKLIKTVLENKEFVPFSIKKLC